MLIYLKYISPVFSKHLFFSNFVILLRAKHKTTKGLQKYVRTYFLPSSNLLASWRNESNYKHVINIWESKGRNASNHIWSVALGQELGKKCT